jgi:topoisomerase-4 subunit A
LDIPIRRISAYDIEKNHRDIEDTELEITKIEAKLKRLTQTTIKYIKDLLKKYGDNYPRRTEIGAFEAVDVRRVARQNIKVSYDPETGFFGSQVKGSEHQFTVSEYDRFLIICKDGSFRIIGPEAKVLIPGKVIYFDVFDQENGAAFTIVYRDKGKIAYGKKIHIKKFIRDREYELIKGRAGKIDFLVPGHDAGYLNLKFVPAKRQRVTEVSFDLSELETIGVTARGSRLAPKPISRIKLTKSQPSDATDTPEENTDAEHATKKNQKKKPPGDGGEQFSLF